MSPRAQPGSSFSRTHATSRPAPGRVRRSLFALGRTGRPARKQGFHCRHTRSSTIRHLSDCPGHALAVSKSPISRASSHDVNRPKAETGNDQAPVRGRTKAAPELSTAEISPAGNPRIERAPGRDQEKACENIAGIRKPRSQEAKDVAMRNSARRLLRLQRQHADKVE